ncbi:MAG TPA: DUF1330 domain-containing protein [Xanthobacteraceae bacterium]|nr:DUF1330 domain-containing protein [Xanthobacteraceae bacterium]
MKTRYPVTLALIAGFGLLVLASQTLDAQARRHAFFVTVFDAESEQEVLNTDYPSLAPATFQPFGGRYAIQSARTIPFDGQPPTRIVVVEFDSMEKLLAWHESAAFRSSYDPHRSARVRAFAVEGMPQGAE